MPITLATRQSVGAIKNALDKVGSSITSFSYSTLSQTVHNQKLACARALRSESSNFDLKDLDSYLGTLDRLVSKFSGMVKLEEKAAKACIDYIGRYLNSPNAEQSKGQGISKLIQFYNKYRLYITFSDKLFSEVDRSSQAASRELSSISDAIKKVDRTFNSPRYPYTDFARLLQTSGILSAVRPCISKCNDILSRK